MRTLRRSLVLLVAVAALAAVPAGSASASTGDYQAASTKDCHARVDFNLRITRANDMGCQRAKREMRRYDGPIKRRFTTPGGFHCERASGSRSGGKWRCHKDGKAFRFRFAD